MPETPLYIMLCSAEHEKIQMAAMTASVAAVSERPVQLFVSMGAIFAFDAQADAEERYRGGEMSDLMKAKKAPDAIELLRQGRDFGELSVYACSMALDINGWDEERLVEGVFDGALGLTRFLSDAESGQLMTF
ncbi:MAG TPA: DsrE/DsrF/DrsH-like family protein [Alphaproteobacteria bacterium]|jgi:peroxiredoxin family protein|nr:DsrE/DsrF/DrsH-like family protein [Alphaproteobacteria bacterium]HJM49428.1 DsrE/DsrF/DrsH-like family protein [Alphaproteobacteria bacterium]